MRRRPILFADIDGTFLHGDEAEGDAANAVLCGRFRAAARVATVVFASSRTATEIATLLRRIGSESDFIAENGAVVAVRDPALAARLEPCHPQWLGGDRFFLKQLAPDAVEILPEVRSLAAGLPRPVMEQLALPADRQSTLLMPSSVVRAAGANRFLADLGARGLHAQNGGRWLSIWKGATKGDAARFYVEAVSGGATWQPITAAIGNAPNDRDLLQAADHRFVIRDPDGGYCPVLAALPGAVRLQAIGPAGWFEALEVFRRRIG